MTTFPFKAPLRWIGVGLCVLAACACAGPLDEKQGFPTNNPPLAYSHSRKGSEGQQGVRAAGQQEGRAGQGPVFWNLPPRVRVWCPSLLLDAEKSFVGSLQSSYTGRLFTLPHRSDRTLGRGPRPEPRAPLQMVSGALGSFRVLGFR